MNIQCVGRVRRGFQSRLGPVTLCGMLKAPKLPDIKALFPFFDCIPGSIRVNRVNYADKSINSCFRKDKTFS